MLRYCEDQTHTYSNWKRTNKQKTLWGFTFFFFFLPSHYFHPRGLWFSHIHIRRRSHSRQAGLCRTGCSQVTLSMASTEADPSRGRCWLLTTHTTMSPVNPPLYGCSGFDATSNWPRWTVAVAAWGPAPLYASPHSHCLHLIRSPLPVVCVYCMYVCTCSISMYICHYVCNLFSVPFFP